MDPAILAALIGTSGLITAVNLEQFSKIKKPKREYPQPFKDPLTGRMRFPPNGQDKEYYRQYVKKIIGYYVAFLTPPTVFAFGFMLIIFYDLDNGMVLLFLSVVLNIISLVCQKKWFS